MAIWISSCSCISRCLVPDWAAGTWGSRASALWRYSMGRLVVAGVEEEGPLVCSAVPVACDALQPRWGRGERAEAEYLHLNLSTLLLWSLLLITFLPYTPDHHYPSPPPTPPQCSSPQSHAAAHTSSSVYPLSSFLKHRSHTRVFSAMPKSGRGSRFSEHLLHTRLPQLRQ